MAALPYMQFYVAEYLADTAHLDAEENGAYLLLIFNYWQTGKPIPKKRLQKVARVSNDRWTSVEEALSEFFTDDGECWVHDRIEADLAAVEEAQAQRAAAGKASAEARKAAKRKELKATSNDRSTPVQRESNDRSTNKEQIRTDKIREEEKDTSASSADDLPSEEVVSLPCKDNTEYQVEPGYLAEIIKLHPKVNVPAELRAMRAWLLSNPAKRKTHHGMTRFINSWLVRAGVNVPSGKVHQFDQYRKPGPKVKRIKIFPGHEPQLLPGEWVEDGYICREESA